MYLNSEGMKASLAPASGYYCGLITPKRDTTLMLHCNWAVDHISCQR